MVQNPSPDSGPAALSPPQLEEDFVADWLECLADACGFAVEYPFAVVRSLSGRTTRVCAPLLTYAHLDEPAARYLYSSFTAGAVQIRCLLPPPPEFAARAPAQSFIPLARWADAGAFWEQGMSGNLRKKIRRCEKGGLRISRGNSRALLEGFYALFLETMHRHGTPPFPYRAFHRILERCDAEVITAHCDPDPVASFFVIYAGPVALFQWAGLKSDPGYATFLGEWAAIQGAIERGCRWFDLGRSRFGGGPFTHKALWRPTLYAPVVVPATPHSVYHKYRLVSAAWRRLPAAIAARLGPRLTPHLIDL